ncbi:MAG: hypothetical protein Q7U36_01610 [bacterium]|nr:hypothetical protein [bacterium]
MADKKSTDKNIRKLTKIGKKSFGITLPIEEVRSLGWKERQKLSVKRIKGGFEVRDWRNMK